MPKRSDINLIHRTIRLPADLVDAIGSCAKEAGMTVADFHRHALREAVARQSQLSELAAIEQRMAMQLTRLHQRFGALQQAQQIQYAVLDQFMKMALALEPDFVDDASRATAQALGSRRHKALMKSVPAALDAPLAKALLDLIGQPPDG